MGGLFDALQIGSSAVDAARAGIELCSHNIANSNTQGFHRRQIRLSPVDPPPVLGGGVRVEGETRVVDALLDRQVTSGTADQGWADTRETLLLQVQQASASIGDSGLSATLSGLFNAFSALSASPADTTTREKVLDAAGQVVDAFHGASAGLKAVADGIEKDIAPALAEVNQKAGQVAELNAKIAASEANGQEASDLRDQRDVLVGDLARIAGAQTITDGSGQTTVLVGGLTLVQGNHAAQLQAQPDAALGGTSRIALVDGATSLDVTARLQSGELGGRLQVRDQVVPGVQAQLDQLAYDLATTVNTQHQAGYGLDGTQTTFFAAPAGVPGAAAGLALRSGITAREVAAASSPGLPGNSDNAIALAGLANGKNAGGGTTTFGGQAATIVGDVGTQVAEGQRESSLRQDQLTHLQSLQGSEESVSLDEEMTQLLTYQRSYQASAHVLQVVDGLLDNLMSI